jgi:hypothetical protein
MKRTGILALATLLFPLAASAHGHPGAVADDDPIAADVRLCNEIVDTALQALADRDKGRPMKAWAGDDLRTRLQNEVTQHVFAEPQIRSQKFAMGYARSRCNEVLQAERDKNPRR